MRAPRTALLAIVLAAGARARAAPVTLEDALAAARAANAALPVARAEVDAGAAATRAARAALGPRVSLDGDLRYAPPATSYNPAVAPIDEERLQVVGEQPLWDGGARRARLTAADASLRAVRARFRVAGRDLDLEVRARFAGAIALEAELAARRDGVAQLRSYLDLVRERIAAGQGAEADRLRTEVRLANEQAGVADAERRLRAATLDLNDLMGRDPAAALELAPLPPPAAPAAAGDEPWQAAPDVAGAEAERDAAAAAVAEALAGRAPRLDLLLDAGIFGPGLPFPGAGETPASRLRSDLGASVTLAFTWPFWDAGGWSARVAEARARAARADGTVVVARRAARLAWRRATSDLDALWGAIGIRAGAVPVARDAWLLAESLYRGGAGSSLEVLDAHAALVEAKIAEATAVERYRVAEAQARRWGER